MGIEPNVERDINKMLDLVPNIQTLVLRRVSRSWVSKYSLIYSPEGVYECPLLCGTQLSNLRELRLLGLSLGINTIALAMRLPKLEVFEVQRLSRDSELIGEKSVGIRSTVKELYLGPFCKPNVNILRLFQWPLGLETLSYDLGAFMVRGPPPDCPTLSQLLAPHVNTLVEINLSGQDNIVIHRGVNFRLFSNLKKLIIASMLLFPGKFEDQEQGPYRNGVYKRLPRSLEHFEAGNYHSEKKFPLLIK